MSEGLWREPLRLWCVVACFVGVAVARSLFLGIPFRDPHGEYLRGRLVQTAVAFVVLVVLDAVLRTARPRRPAGVIGTLRTRWTPVRVALAWSALLAYSLTYVTYHNLKSWDVFNAPRDAMLTSWDRWLFLGHSPAVLLHDLLGTDAAAWVLMAWYESFGALVVAAFPAAVVLARNVRDAYVGIAAFVWVWILGTATYYAIPSLGPFHDRPQDFTTLPHTVIQDNQQRYLLQRDHVLAHPHAADSFAQVSAFASLHVGVTATILGLAWWHRLRRTRTVLLVYLSGTMVATVYLGWHFAVDVVAGLAIAGMAWILGPWTVGARWSRDRARAATSGRPRAVTS